MVQFWGAMSAAPDPAELAPSRDPAAYGGRRLFTGGFVGWIVLCLICLVGGAAIGRFAFAPSEAQGPSAASEPAARGAAAPSSSLAASPAIAPAAATAPPSSTNAASAAPDAALGDRVARLETASAHVSDAAAQALAAASLSTAAQGPAPFDQDVAAYARLVPGDPDLAALAPLAARGAPSRAALAAAFPDLASAAAAASRTPGKDAGYLAHLWAVLGKVVIVRNVDPGAHGVDGLLARAQMAASTGDLESAVRLTDDLPSGARAVLADWRAAAQRRIAIDQAIERLRARALAGLAHSPAAG
ncbi:MAG TPA: mitofilin family membrane protein [Caulobacteraceae bacterium]|nr:mitofilin family membrane protein [Caulobacteraceae bacterium]